VPFPEDVAARVRAGDADAVGEVYAHLADRLLSYLLAHVDDRATAEDILEATFVELLRKGSTIRGGAAAIKVWLFQSARYNLLDQARARRRRPEELVGDLTAFERVDPAPGPHERVEAAETRQVMHDAMSRLSEDQREVLLLRYVSGLSSPEVAQILGKAPGAVRSLQHRAERALARILESDPVSHPTPPAS
jgi:RNA polymerase sigma-70 factor, ECF subfamily